MVRVLGPALFAIFLVTTPLSAAAGTCTSAQVDEAFALPDGSVHPGGRLTLCPGDSSPVSALQRTFVDGRPVGMFASRRQAVEYGRRSEHYLMFNRRPGRPLQLAGLGQPAAGRTEMFLLERPARVEVEDSIGGSVP